MKTPELLTIIIGVLKIDQNHTYECVSLLSIRILLNFSVKLLNLDWSKKDLEQNTKDSNSDLNIIKKWLGVLEDNFIGKI